MCPYCVAIDELIATYILNEKFRNWKSLTINALCSLKCHFSVHVWSPSANQPKYRSFVPSYNFRKSFLNLKATLTKSITCSIAEVLYTVCITSLVPQIYIVTRRLHQWAAITGSLIYQKVVTPVGVLRYFSLDDPSCVYIVSCKQIHV